MDIYTNAIFGGHSLFKQEYSSKTGVSLLRFNSIEDDARVNKTDKCPMKSLKNSNSKCKLFDNAYHENLGFINLGNTCFMNSILQCLRYTKPLVDFCLNGEYHDEIQKNTNCTFIAAYTKLMKVVAKGCEYISPCEFKDHISRLAGRYGGYSQHDAQEFLIFILEMLHCDLKRLNVKVGFHKSKSEVSFKECTENMKRETEIWNLFNNKEDSEIINIFVGRLSSSLKCTNCKNKSITSEPFLDLSLPLAELDRNEITLNDCFTHFTKVEILDGDNKPLCEHCKSKQTFHKKLRIEKFPQILILHLKRFTNTSKQLKMIKFPLRKFNLTKFGDSKGGSALYDLYAVSNHIGTLNRGHYTACAKSEVSGFWNHYNDSKVTRIEESQVVSADAYILFYEKCL